MPAAYAIHDNSAIRPDLPPLWLRFPSAASRDAFAAHFPRCCHISDIGPDEARGVWHMPPRYGGTRATSLLASLNGLIFQPR